MIFPHFSYLSQFPVPPLLPLPPCICSWEALPLGSQQIQTHHFEAGPMPFSLYLGWTRYPFKDNGLQKATSSTKDKYWSHCPWCHNCPMDWVLKVSRRNIMTDEVWKNEDLKVDLHSSVPILNFWGVKMCIIIMQTVDAGRSKGWLCLLQHYVSLSFII